MSPEEFWLVKSLLLALAGGAVIMLIFLHWTDDE